MFYLILESGKIGIFLKISFFTSPWIFSTKKGGKKMKPLCVTKTGVITDGILKGISGLIVAFDSEQDKVIIKLDKITYVQISSDFVYQGDKALNDDFIK